MTPNPALKLTGRYVTSTWRASSRPAGYLSRQATHGEHLANRLVPSEPDPGRPVAHLERRTPWDS